MGPAPVRPDSRDGDETRALLGLPRRTLHPFPFVDHAGLRRENTAGERATRTVRVRRKMIIGPRRGPGRGPRGVVDSARGHGEGSMDRLSVAEGAFRSSVFPAGTSL